MSDPHLLPIAPTNSPVDGSPPRPEWLEVVCEGAIPDGEVRNRLLAIADPLTGLGDLLGGEVLVWDRGQGHLVRFSDADADRRVAHSSVPAAVLDENATTAGIVEVSTAQLADPTERQRRQAAGIASTLSMPLRAGNEVLGVLLAERGLTDPLPGIDAAIMHLVANAATIILAQAREHTDLFAEQHANQVMRDVAQAAAAQREPRAILHRLAADVRTELASDCVQIEVWHHGDGKIEVVAEAPSDRWRQLLPEKHVYVAEEWSSLDGIRRGDDHLYLSLASPNCPARERRYLRNRGIGSLLTVPVRAGDDIIGTIVELAENPDAPLLDHLPFLHRVAALASIPLQAKQDNIQRRRDERRGPLLRHLSDAIAVRPDLQHVLDDATQGLIGVTSADLCVAIIHGPEQEPLARSQSVASRLLELEHAPLDVEAWPALSRLSLDRRIVAFGLGATDVGEADATTLGDRGLVGGVAAAITNGRQAWGTITLLFPRGMPTGDVAVDPVADVAALLAVAAADDYTIRDLAGKTADLEILLEVSRAAVSGKDLADVLADICRLALRHERFQSSAVARLDSSRDDLCVLASVAETGIHVPGPGARLTLANKPAIGRVLDERTAHQILASDPMLTTVERRLFDATGLGSLLLMPLSVGDQLYGLLHLGSWSHEPLLDRHLRFAEEIAGQASQAIDRSSLVAALTARADRDGLTGLLNHRAIQERLDNLLARATLEKGTLSILMVDLDGFKLFNDTYGHLVGDRYLRETAAHIAAALGSRGTLGRYGGDEFLAVLPDCSVDDAVVVARDILERIDEIAFEIGETRLPIQLSIGAATYPRQGRSRRALVERADASMYAAKDAGGGRVVQFDRSPVSSGNDPFSVLTGLVQAVDRKDRYTRRHSDRVTALAITFGRELGLAEDELAALYIAGQLHDVGKIAMPDNLLRRPGAISSEQIEIMHQHVTFSEMMIRDVPHEDLVMAAVAHHHERWDGGGYPRGLAGDEISLLGRILAIADTVAAMTQDRPYVKARTWDSATAELRANAGSQFDPTLAGRFADLLVELGDRAAIMPPAPAVLTAASSTDPG